MKRPPILDRLDKVRRVGSGWRAICPCHDDHTPSLGVDVKGTTVLVFCQVCGADGKAVCEALGIDAAEYLYLGGPKSNGSGTGIEVARHRYADAKGTALFDSVRYEPKAFRLYLPEQSSGGIGDAPRVLYRLPQLVAAVAAGETVYIVEGEKDAERLAAAGLTATTNPMGAGKWSKVDPSPLAGASVVIVPDNDEPGRKHGAEVRADLESRGCTVKVVELPHLPPGGDVSDWLDAGGTVEELRRLAEAARNGQAVSLYEPGGVIFDTPAEPVSLWGQGSESLAAAGEPTIIYAGTGIGKTTLAQLLVLSAIGVADGEVLGYPVIHIEGKVLYIAADRPRQAKRSLRRMVTPADRKTLNERLIWEARRTLRADTEDPEALLRTGQELGVELIVIDSIKDFVTEVSSEVAGQTFNAAVQHCTANGVEVIALHHPRKTTTEGGTRTLSLDDVYGSTWLTAGAGSVIALNGVAGSGVFTLQQLKMPAEEVGPFDVTVEYDTGRLSTIGVRDLRAFFEQVGTATTAEAVRFVVGGGQYTDAQRKKTYRKLEKLERDGLLTQEDHGKTKVWAWSGPLVHVGGQVIMDSDRTAIGRTRSDGHRTHTDAPPPDSAKPVGSIDQMLSDGRPDAIGRTNRTVSPPSIGGETSAASAEDGRRSEGGGVSDPPAVSGWAGVVEHVERRDGAVIVRIRGRAPVTFPVEALEGSAFGEGDTVRIDETEDVGRYAVTIVERKDPM